MSVVQQDSHFQSFFIYCPALSVKPEERWAVCVWRQIYPGLLHMYILKSHFYYPFVTFYSCFSLSCFLFHHCYLFIYLLIFLVPPYRLYRILFIYGVTLYLLPLYHSADTCIRITNPVFKKVPTWPGIRMVLVSVSCTCFQLSVYSLTVSVSYIEVEHATERTIEYKDSY